LFFHKFVDANAKLQIAMLIIISLLFCLSMLEDVAADERIYQTDSLGNIQYHKPSYTVRKDGRVIETDRYGNKQYHKPQFQIKGDKLYAADAVGNIQYHKLQKSLIKH
jgi:hypothetical protein